MFSDVLILTELRIEYLDTIVSFQRPIFVENESEPSILLFIHATCYRKNTLRHSVCIEMIERTFFFDFIINLNILLSSVKRNKIEIAMNLNEICLESE